MAVRQTTDPRRVDRVEMRMSPKGFVELGESGLDVPSCSLVVCSAGWAVYVQRAPAMSRKGGGRARE